MTRREFMRVFGVAAGFTLAPGMPRKILAALRAGRPGVIWLQGSGCSGCSCSLLNTVHPSLVELFREIISLEAHPLIMGDSAGTAAKRFSSGGGHILVVEGAIPEKAQGRYCTFGERGGRKIPFREWVAELSRDARAVVAVGTCAAFGGISGAGVNPTGARGVRRTESSRVVRIPGCPPHPDWIVGTLVHLIRHGMPELDRHGAPKLFFGRSVHEQCPHRSEFERGVTAKRFGEPGCTAGLGCRGTDVNADCPSRWWNGETSWCVEAGGPCIACVSSSFPGTGPFYRPNPAIGGEGRE